MIAAKPDEAEKARVLRDARIPVTRALEVKQDAEGFSAEVVDVAMPVSERGRRPLAIELALRAATITEADAARAWSRR